MSRRAAPRSTRRRARIALALAVTWLFAFELLPLAHIALHDHLAPHHHDADGEIVIGPAVEPVDAAAPPIVRVHFLQRGDDLDLDAQLAQTSADRATADDDLDAQVDEHGAPIAHPPSRAHRDAPVDPHARLAAALAHGAHSLAHHGVALAVPSPVVTSPLPIDRRPTFVAAIDAIEPISFSPGRAVARGPPA